MYSKPYIGCGLLWTDLTGTNTVKYGEFNLHWHELPPPLAFTGIGKLWLSGGDRKLAFGRK
jgi:hypothetical protein